MDPPIVVVGQRIANEEAAAPIMGVPATPGQLVRQGSERARRAMEQPRTTDAQINVTGLIATALYT